MANKKNSDQKTILIIEDEKILLDVLVRKIKDKGFNVITAEDGEAGIKQMKEKKPDLIILDMLLPKIDGYGVLEERKRCNIDIPVFIVSNSGQPVDIDRALKLGACDYLVKTEFEPEEVIEKIGKCLVVKQGNNKDKPGAKRILVVEDDKFLRDLCVKKLDQVGFDVESAADGIEGLEKIIKTKPDLVLLDIILPGLEGFDILKKVRAEKNKSIANVPIIVLSNLGQESDVEKALKLGANDYLIKAHFTIDDIIEKIKKLLG